MWAGITRTTRPTTLFIAATLDKLLAPVRRWCQERKVGHYETDWKDQSLP
jgi:hypothetical protein